MEPVQEPGSDTEQQLQALYVLVKDGMAVTAAAEGLAQLLQNDSRLAGIFEQGQVADPRFAFYEQDNINLILRLMSRFAEWSDIAKFSDALLDAVRSRQRQALLEQQAAELYRGIRSNPDADPPAALLRAVAGAAAIRRIAEILSFQFGFTKADVQRELDLPELVWEAMTHMPEWRGWPAFKRYFALYLRREHLRDLARNLRGARRISDDAVDLLELVHSEFSDVLLAEELLTFLANHLGKIQDLAKKHLGFTFKRTLRATENIARARGIIALPLEEFEFLLEGSSITESEPQWLVLLMQRLTTEQVIPPPPVEIAKLMLETRLDALEDSDLRRIWVVLKTAHPEYNYTAQRWSQLFFALNHALQQHLLARFNWAQQDWHRAFWLWLRGDRHE